MRTLYRASLVRTLSYPQTGEWVVVDGRHVQRVGSGEPPDADRVVDLPGTTIVPGMIDAHVHLMGIGLSLANEDVARAPSAAALLEIAKARAAEGEGVVLLRGFDESTWGDPRFPSLGELDAITERPLVIKRTDGHLGLVNSAALREADAEGAAGLGLDAQGHPTGVVSQEANDLVTTWAIGNLSDHELQGLQLRGAAVAAASGVTSLHEMSLPNETGERDLEVFLGHRSNLPVDALPIVATMDVARAIELRSSAIGGDLPVDGSLGARTAALVDPYLDGEGDGVCYYEDDQLAQFFHDGHNAGLQVGVHAIGDRAIEQVLRVWERVYGALDSRDRRHFRARRHRVEHASMATPSQIERAAMLGLAISIQPSFDLSWGQPGGLYESRLGDERADGMHAVRTMLDRGIEVGAGSDAPVLPLDPWLTVHALEHHHRADQRLSRFEAIRLHTLGSARLGHQEEKKGALEPGLHADFAAYERDPFETEETLGLRPILTVSLGREVSSA